MFLATMFFAMATAGPATADPEARVAALLDEQCSGCHGAGGDPADPGGLDLSRPPSALVGMKSVVNGRPLVVPGDPDASYLLAKIVPGATIDGDVMPVGDALPPEQVDAVRQWIATLSPPATTTPAVAPTSATATTNASTPTTRRERTPGTKPFHGTTQIVLPSTTTLGKLNLQYRIDHRFGRIGTERGAFGLDAGATMSFGIGYGILDGWDVLLRRTNSKKGWELATKYVPLRQEAGMPLSLGAYVSMDWFRDFGVANPISGNFMLLLSRLWLSRWSTMLTFGYHLPTNHSSFVMVDPGDGRDPVHVLDRRGTLDLGFASTVWLGKRKRWGLELEYILPIPDGGRPNRFYYHGGDADRQGSPIGAWGLGGSYSTGRHFFQVFVTNNREIHPGLWAPGGQTGNPFAAPGVDSKNPFHRANFFLGFNLGRTFSLQAAAQRGKERRARRKERT